MEISCLSEGHDKGFISCFSLEHITPSHNIATFRFFKVTFLTLSNNISKNKLFETEKVTCYNTWFYDTKIIFYVISLYEYFAICSQN